MPAPPPTTASQPHRSSARLAVLAILVCALGCARGPRLEAPQQVIVLSIDTLRADFLGPWRRNWGVSPHFDHFAAESLVFRDTVTSWPDTSASHKSLLYGVYHHVHQTSYAGVPGVDAEIEAPVEALRRQGLRTAAIFSLDGGVLRGLGLHHGFEVFSAATHTRDPSDDLNSLRKRVGPWLAAHRDEPFFLLVHTYQVHAPYHPPEPYLSEALERHGLTGSLPAGFPPPHRARDAIAWWRQDVDLDKLRLLRAVYEGEVAAVDAWFGEWIEELRRLGIYDRAAIIVTADHGEALGEGGHVGHSHLGEEQTRIPLMIRVPGIDPAVIEDPASIVDVMPTVFGLLGLAPPYPLQGRDLLASSEEGAGRLRPVENVRDVALYRQDWKLHISRENPERRELIDLEGPQATRVDPLAHGPAVDDLVRRYGALLREARPLTRRFSGDQGNVDSLSEDALNTLRGLGYLD